MRGKIYSFSHFEYPLKLDGLFVAIGFIQRISPKDLALEENYVQPGYNSIVKFKETDRYKIYLSQWLFGDRFVGFKELAKNFSRATRDYFSEFQSSTSSEIRGRTSWGQNNPKTDEVRAAARIAPAAA